MESSFTELFIQGVGWAGGQWNSTPSFSSPKANILLLGCLKIFGSLIPDKSHIHI